MEKFTNFRDPGTGISPFMPVPDEDRGRPVVRRLKWVAALPLILLRVPFFLVLAVLLAVPNEVIKRGASFFLLNFVFSLNLGRGFLSDLAIEGVKRSSYKKVQASLPLAGQVIICNYTSGLDALVCYLLGGGGVFVLSNGNGELVKYSLLEFLLYSIGWQCAGAPVEDLSKYADEIVFLFVEGTASNGKSILKYNVPQKVDLKLLKVRLMTVRLSPPKLTTPVPDRFYWARLLRNVSLRFRIRIAECPGLSWDEIRQKSSEISRLRLVDLGVKEKQQFLGAYSR